MVLLLSFAVVLFGGLNNIKGIFVSTFALGMVMSVIGRLWGPAVATMVFIAIGITLIFKPGEV